MTLLLRDSVDPFAIPLDNLAAVAGYGDGAYVWSSEGWARFPPPIVPLSIVINAASAGDILDVEMGDATPADCPGWADRFHRANRRRPTIYCNRSTIQDVRNAMGSRPFDWWAATLDGTQFVNGAVAVQYAGSDITKANYDESIIWDASWIGVNGGSPVSYPRPANDWWGWPYVSGATLAVELNSKCHGNVISTNGEWFQLDTPIGSTALGQFAEWILANEVGGVWYDMDESGGPTGSPAGRQPPAQSFWVSDSAIDTTGCGGTDPVAVATKQGGKIYDVSGGANPQPPIPIPPPGPNVTAAIASIKTAQVALDQALKDLGA